MHVEHDRIIIRCFDGVDHLDIRVGIRLIAVFKNAFKRPLDVLGGEGLAVVPLDALAQMEGIGHQIIRNVPRFCQIGIDRLGIFVPGAELGEDVVADIDNAAVPLIVRLVEGRLQLRRNDQRAAIVMAIRRRLCGFRCAGFRRGSIRLCGFCLVGFSRLRAAARRTGKKHQKCQQ